MNVLPLHRLDRSTSRSPRRSVDQFNLSGLDSLRVAAALGVVMLHAAVPYLRHPMPGLDWPVRETSSDLVDFAFWSIEVFIMPVFLIIAGLLAWQSLRSRGPADLLRHRVKRLGKPLLFGMLVILPIDLYVWVAGYIYEGRVEPIKIRSLKIDGPLGDNLWGTSHLWFLIYLMLYIACLALAMMSASTRLGVAIRSRWPNGLTRQLPLGLLIAGVSAVTLRSEIVWGFQHAFAPVPSKWIYSGTFFAGGLWLAHRTDKLDSLIRHWRRLLVPSLMVLIAAVLLGQWHLGESSQSIAARDTIRLARPMLAILTVVAAWSVSLTAIGGCLATFRNTSTAVSYLAAASLWIYLMHHPLLGLIHIDLKYLVPQASGVTKWIASFAIATAASLMLYESFVRRTAVGRFLGVNWQRPVVDDTPGAGHDGSIHSIRMPAAAPDSAAARRAA